MTVYASDGRDIGERVGSQKEKEASNRLAIIVTIFRNLRSKN